MPFPVILALPRALVGAGALVTGAVWGAVKLGERSVDRFGDDLPAGGGGSPADDAPDHGQEQARTMEV